MPATCFGQSSCEYIDGKLVTTFIIDSDGWTVINDVDEVHAVAMADRADVMSVGTAGFIASMERDPNHSGSSADTVLEVATPDDLAELNKYVFYPFGITLNEI